MQDIKWKRFTELFKILLWHSCPKCYSLRTSLNLSYDTTLQNCMKNIDVKPGFYSSTFNSLKKRYNILILYKN